jgi:hypothetical protein
MCGRRGRRTQSSSSADRVMGGATETGERREGGTFTASKGPRPTIDQVREGSLLATGCLQVTSRQAKGRIENGGQAPPACAASRSVMREEEPSVYTDENTHKRGKWEGRWQMCHVCMCVCEQRIRQITSNNRQFLAHDEQLTPVPVQGE